MRSITVLVAAYDDRAARTTAATLEALGYAVPATYSSGETLLQQIPQYQPDLILSDTQLMGTIDGIAAATMIQQRYNIPVVYLSDQADAQTLERVRASRSFGYINQSTGNPSTGQPTGQPTSQPIAQPTVNPLILATTIDIALARHQAERHLTATLKQSQQQCQQKEQQIADKLQYFAMAAHALRNPLGVTRSVAELLTSSEIELSAERRHRYLQRMLTATDNLDELLQSILTYSYANVGKLDSIPKSIDLVEFCTEQIDRFQTSSGQQHQFFLKKQAPKCPIFIDRELMWHLLTNLLANAVKYSPNQENNERQTKIGQHTIEKPTAGQTKAGPSAIGQITIDLQWSRETVTISIADNGIGIPVSAQSRLFEPFYRADNAVNIPGTGLGLALSQQCAERLGGDIRFDRDHHPGTRFIVRLPIDSRPPL
jgi:signal transduction histidine kinase